MRTIAWSHRVALGLAVAAGLGGCSTTQQVKVKETGGRECVFLETASGARSFPVPAGNDPTCEGAGGVSAR